MTKEIDIIHKCLGCGADSDRLTGVTGAAAPSPGDIILCMYCGYQMAFAEDLSFRQLTIAEKFIVDNDPEFIKMEHERERLMKERNTRIK